MLFDSLAVVALIQAVHGRPLKAVFRAFAPWVQPYAQLLKVWRADLWVLRETSHSLPEWQEEADVAKQWAEKALTAAVRIASRFQRHCEAQPRPEKRPPRAAGAARAGAARAGAAGATRLERLTVTLGRLGLMFASTDAA